MSSYEMKKSLRKTQGAPKSYAEVDEEAEINPSSQKKSRDGREGVRESIFQHKNWSIKQKIKLMVFLAFYTALPDWASERRSIYLYKHLSNFLKKTRTPEQCKNIHSLLKRKFISLSDVIEAMQDELETEQNYDKLLTKYEKDIISFENQNRLFQNIVDDQKYESLRSRRATEKEDRQSKNGNEHNFRDDMRNCKTQQERYETGRSNFKSTVKHEDQGDGSFLERREQLLKECNYYFQEWMLYSCLYQQRQRPDSTQ